MRYGIIANPNPSWVGKFAEAYKQETKAQRKWLEFIFFDNIKNEK